METDDNLRYRGLRKLAEGLVPIGFLTGLGLDLHYIVGNFSDLTLQSYLLSHIPYVIPCIAGRLFDMSTTSFFAWADIHSGKHTRDDVHLNEDNSYHSQSMYLWRHGRKGKAALMTLRKEGTYIALSFIFPELALAYTPGSFLAGINNTLIGVNALRYPKNRRS